jgi:hypothetical protein
MTGKNGDFVKKDICDEKHQIVCNKIIDLKANIHTSKESLSNRIAEVDAALLGDRSSPGGLLRDVIELKKEVKEYNEKTEKELKEYNEKTLQNIITYKENITKDINFLKAIVSFTLGLIVLMLGGKFFGIDLKTCIDYFSRETKIVAKNKFDNIDENKHIIQEFKNDNIRTVSENKIHEEIQNIIKQYLEMHEQLNNKITDTNSICPFIHLNEEEYSSGEK